MDTTLARIEREAADGRVTEYALGVERMRAGRCPACGGPTSRAEPLLPPDDRLRAACRERAARLLAVAGVTDDADAVDRLALALLPADVMWCSGEEGPALPGGRVESCGWSLSAGWSNPDDPQAGDPGRVAIGSDVYPVTVIRRTRMTMFVARDMPMRNTIEGGPTLFMPAGAVAGAQRHIVLDLFTRRKDGTWKRGRRPPERFSAGQRKTYTDPHL